MSGPREFTAKITVLDSVTGVEDEPFFAVDLEDAVTEALEQKLDRGVLAFVEEVLED